jgi:NADPH:quinone reductase-like Zn-dependent oxidoreductase
MAATIPETMRALRLHRRGGATHLRYEETAVPLPAVGDVLVRVHAASFTPTELDWPSTWVDRSGHDRRPVIPGHEVSGVVAALGFGTSGLAVGEEVYGSPTGTGTAPQPSTSRSRHETSPASRQPCPTHRPLPLPWPG